MNELPERAARLGIEATYRDGFGREQAVQAETLERLIAILSHASRPAALTAADAAGLHAYQGSARLPEKSWALAVQLYNVTSRRNLGHGNFTDLKALIELAAALGASGIGLNPLHALFDELGDAASPYYPSSRLFLNTRYIDPEAIPESPPLTEEDRREAAALKQQPLIDYARVSDLQQRLLARAYAAFRQNATASRRGAFVAFRARGGALLARFAAFEYLRRMHDGPWWNWPDPWRVPNDAAIAKLQREQEDALGFYEFLQWTADAQLQAARARADALTLGLGLYLDIAVGVRADGFDAWNEQGVIERGLEIGAPPDPLNLEGQRWGLAGVNPHALAAVQGASFRRVLAASMRYAGAVRLDHAMALQRLYMIPAGMRGDAGAYVGFPFELMLAIVMEESARHRCIVIGEDLGTVPEGFRERLKSAGIWSYQVMLFQRAADGGFVAPDMYRRDALVTFATHDLPTFPGWMSGRDIAVKQALNLDPGETAQDRSLAKDAMLRTMTWHGFPVLDYLGVIGFLASTPSRLLVISLEDLLEQQEQVNVPGTVSEHPNWLRRLTIGFEDLSKVPLLQSATQRLAEAERAQPGSSKEIASALQSKS